MSPTIDQFVGCLLGQTVGDAVGAPYEGCDSHLVWQLAGEDVFQAACKENAVLHYTDDTQMAIGVAEALVSSGQIVEEELAQIFAANYQPNRGYGQGARKILAAIAEGDDWRALAQTIFPGGSLGNGAAMRAAPLGLYFWNDLDRVCYEAERSALPTHTHPIGIDSARLMALAVALALPGGRFRRQAFFGELRQRAQTDEFRWQLELVAELKPSDSLSAFGNSLEAHRSVVTALGCFAASPDNYVEVITRAILQGNDTDTLAAMAGAVSGARLGRAAIPPAMIGALEDGAKGRAYLEELAQKLFARAPAAE